MLKGASRLLTVDKPVFFMELLRKWSRAFGYQPDDVLKLMAEHGYACWAIGYGTPKGYQHDHFWGKNGFTSRSDRTVGEFQLCYQ